MTKISGATFFAKTIFPIVWFGFLLLFLIVLMFSKNKVETPIAFVMPAAMMVLGFFVCKNTIWDLADEAFDNGDALVFRKGGKEQVVRLADIMNISGSANNSIERITITVRTAGAIGEELVFMPPMRFNLFKTHPMVSDLILRVDQARRAS